MGICSCNAKKAQKTQKKKHKAHTEKAQGFYVRTKRRHNQGTEEAQKKRQPFVSALSAFI